MPRKVDLPSEFSRPFHVRAAHAAGIGEGRLRGADLDRPFRGVRSIPGPLSGRAADEVRALAAAYAPLLRPGDRFSHSTAARLWGCPIDAGPLIHVTNSAGAARPRGAGIRGHETAAGETWWRMGLPVSDPVTALIELSNVAGLDTVVKAGDHLVLAPHRGDRRDPRPYVDLPALVSQIDERRDKGVRVAREAVKLVRAGAESPTETELRLLLQRAGFPEPVLGYKLLDERGRFVGWFDLAWPDCRVIVEYDGDQHRTSTKQYEQDIRRFDRASDLGWRDVRVRSHGLYVDPNDTIRRVTAAFTHRGG